MSKAGPFRFQLEGQKELRRMLRNLGPRVARNVMTRAVRGGTRPIVQTAKAKASAYSESGLLVRSLGASVRFNKRTGRINGRMAPRHGEKWSGEWQGKTRTPSHYAHLVEQGFTHTNGTVVAGRPFLGPAADEQQGQAFGNVAKTLREGIHKEALKAKKKGGRK